MKLTILIPFYNDAAQLRERALALAAAIAKLPWACEVLFCDDGSTDGGADVIKGLSLPGVFVVSGAHLGKGGALRRGVLAASGDVIFYTDVDLAYGTEPIEPFVKEALGIGGIAVGRRQSPADYGNYSALRRVLSRTYRRVVARRTGLAVTDTQSGCKAYTRDAAVQIFTPLVENGFSFEVETLMRAQKKGIAISELPIAIKDPSRGSHVRPIRDGVRMYFATRRIVKRVRRE